jgi:succinoglycan biosynthesis protein ExoV
LNIEYCRLTPPNFGDELNAWLWPQLIPELLAQDDNSYLIGIGTIFSQRCDELPSDAKKIVFSSGTGYTPNTTLDENWDVIGVRGKLTAQAYDLPDDKVLCDGAYLLRKVKLPPVEPNNRTGFMPHYSSLEIVDWQDICNKVGLEFISPYWDVETVLAKMQGCKNIITEAMHGAIVADVLRIPWCAVSFGPKFLPSKWLDWGSAVDIEPNIQAIPFVINKRVSKGKVFEWRVKRILSKVSLGKKKWQSIPKFNKNIDELIHGLQSIKAKNSYQLSSDASIAIVDAKLEQALEYLIRVYTK